MTMKKLYKLMEEAGDGNDLPGAPQTEENPSVDDGMDWGHFAGLGGDEEEGVEEIGQQPTEPSAPAQPESPETAVPPVEPPPAEPLQEAAPAPEQPPQTPVTPEQVAAWQAAEIDRLSKAYSFDEETALQLQTEPEKVLPKLAAQLHIDVMQRVMQEVGGFLPQAMEQYTRATTRETQAKGDFYNAWPELKGFESQVLQIGAMYRKMNPTAPAQEAILRIGETAMAALGLKRTPPQQQQEPVAPSRPFAPAAPGRVSTPAHAPSEWEDLASDDDL